MQPFYDGVLDKSRKMIDMLAQSWREALQQEVERVESGCPQWQPSVGKLMSKECTKLALELVKNKEFPNLGGLAKAIQNQVGLLKSIHKDGMQPLVDADTISKASSVAKLAVDTVVVTNAVFKMRVELPRVTNAMKKEEETKKVLDLIKKNGTVVGDDILEAIDLALGKKPAKLADPTGAELAA